MSLEKDSFTISGIFFLINEGYIKIHFTKNCLDIYFIIIYYIYSSFMSDMFDRFRTKNSFTVLIVQSFFIYLLTFWQMTTFWHKTVYSTYSFLANCDCSGFS